MIKKQLKNKSMSKIALKKELNSFTKEQLVGQILELYDTYKQVKEYYKHYLNPQDESDLMEKYKSIIVTEFYPKSNRIGDARFSVAKKAIADFRALHPSPDLLAELLVTLPEQACQFTHDYGDMSEQYYTSAANNFEVALKFLKKENLLDKFKSRCRGCVDNSECCGYGFRDDMEQLFDDYYPDLDPEPDE
ncbi:MAG: DUF6155 family protein [Prevotellaceae bacterium]|jgi:hypothetical protein|nr:DUF6155 family protein [Prevotellaceae bacterium]